MGRICSEDVKVTVSTEKGVNGNKRDCNILPHWPCHALIIVWETAQAVVY